MDYWDLQIYISPVEGTHPREHAVEVVATNFEVKRHRLTTSEPNGLRAYSSSASNVGESLYHLAAVPEKSTGCGAKNFSGAASK